MAHHGAGLRKLSGSDTLAVALQADWKTAPVCAADRAMLAYAMRLTTEPWSVTADDVEELRRAGFADAAILDICQITGYFAFVNRLADGLGVELEPGSGDP